MDRTQETILTDELSYNKSTNTFVAEASDLRLQRTSLVGYVVYNPITQMSEYFKYTTKDTDGEDTFGWNYQSHQGTNLLIIND